MKSHYTSSADNLRGEARAATRHALEAVQIGNDLIAFYSQKMHLPQPYVILLDSASGILKRLDLKAAK
jgi:hypothetical protein